MISTIIRNSIKKGIFKNPNPAQHIDNIKVDNKRERYLTKSEIKELLEKLKNLPELLLFTKLPLNTGGRLNTILSIQKKDLNLEHNSVTLTDHKNVCTYTGYYDDELKYYLKNNIENLYPNDNIIKYHQVTLSNKLRKLNFNDADIKEFATFYDLNNKMDLLSDMLEDEKFLLEKVELFENQNQY